MFPTLTVLLYVIYATTALIAKYDPKYVSSFTPASFGDTNEVLANSTDGVYLVKFYHPSCGYCQALAPQFNSVVAYLRQHPIESIPIKAATVDCSVYRSTCGRFFPEIKLYNLNGDGKANGALEGSEEGIIWPFIQETLNKTLNISVPDHDFSDNTNNGSARIRTIDISTHRDRLADAAVAFTKGLSFVVPGNELSSEGLDALKDWIYTVSRTFPGLSNRLMIQNLYEKVKSWESFDLYEWKILVAVWLSAAREESGEDFPTVEAGEVGSYIFANKEFRVCGDQNCGTWWLFHLMTVNPLEKLDPQELPPEKIFYAIRNFMKHFFHCTPCSEHFLSENPITRGEEIANGQLNLITWLYEMHNSVNQRLCNETWFGVDELVIPALTKRYGYRQMDLRFPDTTWLSLFGRDYDLNFPILTI